MKGDMMRAEMQGALGLKGQGNFRALYLVPALNSRLIEMTIPGKSKSRFQKYRLTEKGKKILQLGHRIES
jgi:ATP-dependent DNA helicase RecG